MTYYLGYTLKFMSVKYEIMYNHLFMHHYIIYLILKLYYFKENKLFTKKSTKFKFILIRKR